MVVSRLFNDGSGNYIAANATVVTLLVTKLMSVVSGELVIIFSGYISSRANIVSLNGVRGINQFILKLCVPSLLFRVSSQTDLFSVNWGFLIHMMIALLIIFSLTLVVSLVWDGRSHNLGIAAVNALCTSYPSTIFLGLPIVSQLWPGSHNTIYCILCFTLCSLTIFPIGIALLELNAKMHTLSPDAVGFTPDVESATSTIRRQRNWFSISLSIVTKTLTHPTVYPVLLGFIWSLTTDARTLPTFIDVPLDYLGMAASGTALFSIGLSMNMNYKTEMSTQKQLLLITIRQIVSPLFVTISFFIAQPIYNPAPELVKIGIALSSLPPAQALFSICTTYRVGEAEVRSSVVLGTLASFPLCLFTLMFINIQGQQLLWPHALTTADFDLVTLVMRAGELTSVAALLYFVTTIIMTKTLRRFPKRLVVYLSFCQGLGAICYGIKDTVLALGEWTGTAWAIRLGESHTLCIIQAVLIHFTQSSAYLWFLMISVDLLLCGIKRSRSSLRYEMLYHCLVWAGAATTTLSVLSLNIFGGTWGFGESLSAWCWIPGKYTQFTSFYIPQLLCEIISISCIMFIQRRLGHSKKRRGGRIDTKFNARLRFLVILFIIVWMWGQLNRLSQLVMSMFGVSGKAILLLTIMHTYFSVGSAIISLCTFGLHPKVMAEYRVVLDRAGRAIRWMAGKKIAPVG